MSPLLAVFVLTQSCGLLILLHVIRTAPEGYEDEKGFHFAKPARVRSNRSASAQRGDSGLTPPLFANRAASIFRVTD
jgi:hypothetical protein